MNKKKLLVSILAFVLVLSMLFTFVACDNTNENGDISLENVTQNDIPKNRALFFFQKEGKQNSEVYKPIHTDEFKKDATIKDVFDFDIKSGNLKYGFGAKFDSENKEKLVKIQGQDIVANARQEMQIFTTLKPVSENVESYKVGDKTLYKTDINCKLQEKEVYLFFVKDTNFGSLSATVSPINYTADPVIDGNFTYVFSGEELVKYELKDKADKSGKEYVEVAKNTNLGFDKITFGDFSYYNVGCKPIIAGNMIICASNGKVQAFDKQTLKKLWVYAGVEGEEVGTTYLGGINSNMVFDSKTSSLFVPFSSVLVSMNVTDTDTNVDTDAPKQNWVNKNLGNFYWDEGIVIEDYFIIGTNQVIDYTANPIKVTKKAGLYALDKTTGKEKQKIEVDSDISCGITYDSNLDLLFFTTKDSVLHRVQYKNGETVFGRTKDVKLKGVESTCTPAIYNGRLYVTSGQTIFDVNFDPTKAESTGYMQVIDMVTLDIINTVDVKGYSQGKPCVSAVGEDVFVYFTKNSYEGGIYYIVDNATADSAVLKTLFKPATPQFCTSSIQKVGDTLYYRNDSNTIFAYKEFN